MIRNSEIMFRDHDYIETEEGWIFCVVSDQHPRDRVCAYLKYIPGDGRWSKNGVSYERVVKYYKMDEIIATLNLLEKTKPEYIYHDPVINEKFSYIPVGRIKEHFRCEERLKSILGNPRNKIEEKTRGLVDSLVSKSDVSPEYMGITGSILVELANPQADIDLIVYGRENFWRVVSAIPSISENNDLRSGFMNSLMKKYPLSREDSERLAERMVNRGVYEGKVFSTHAVRLLSEVREAYGDKVFQPVGVVKSRLRVVDDCEGCFTPAIYYVEPIGSNFNRIETLTCYDTTYACLLREGDVIECVGKLEEVYSVKEDRHYLNLVIGSIRAQGREYVRIVGES